MTSDETLELIIYIKDKRREDRELADFYRNRNPIKYQSEIRDLAISELAMSLLQEHLEEDL